MSDIVDLTSMHSIITWPQITIFWTNDNQDEWLWTETEWKKKIMCDKLYIA